MAVLKVVTATGTAAIRRRWYRCGRGVPSLAAAVAILNIIVRDESDTGIDVSGMSAVCGV